MNIILCAGLLMLLVAGVAIAIAKMKNKGGSVVSVNDSRGPVEVIVEEVPQQAPCPVVPAAPPDQRGKVQRGLFEPVRESYAVQKLFFTELVDVLNADEAAQKERDAFKRRIAETVGVKLPAPVVVVPSPVVPAAAPVPAPVAAP